MSAHSSKYPRAECTVQENEHTRENIQHPFNDQVSIQHRTAAQLKVIWFRNQNKFECIQSKGKSVSRAESSTKKVVNQLAAGQQLSPSSPLHYFTLGRSTSKINKRQLVIVSWTSQRPPAPINEEPGRVGQHSAQELKERGHKRIQDPFPRCHPGCNHSYGIFFAYP